MTTVLSAGYIRRLWPEKIPELKKDADYVVENLEDLEAIASGFYR
jgi:hypothetical protein